VLIYEVKYIDSFRLEIDGTSLTKTCDIAEEFSKPFHSLQAVLVRGRFALLATVCKFMFISHLNSDGEKAVKSLPVGSSGISIFLFRNFVVLVPEFILNLSQRHNTFLNMWKRTDLFLFFKKTDVSLLVIIGLYLILIIFL
jgi:hypothetical protein